MGRRPERTVYRLTANGQHEVVSWLRDLLAQPVNEPSQFFAALSFLPHLRPEDALEQLAGRVNRLETEIAGLDSVLQAMVPRIGRLLLVEVEYTRAMRQAELVWVRSLIDDLGAGRLAWDPDVLIPAVAAAATGDSL